MHKMLPAILTASLAALGLTACSSDSNVASHQDPAQPANILFVIMDDVGIDQMASFGYGGVTPPSMPNIDAVADAGIRFRNTWTMPECSPSRAAFFVGRYPIRTNIYQALGPSDLANSHISPFDATVPKLLKQAGYESGLFGKFHLGGPENNQAGNALPSALGWDHFYGWVGGLPGSVDSTAGGVGSEGQYSCGFVPGQHAGGAETGACYQSDHSCTVLQRTSLTEDAAGLQCVASGGIFVPDEICGTPPSSLNFNRLNGYYVSPLVIIDGEHVEEVALNDPRARVYRTRLETDAAIEWIKARPADTPWMATVSYTAVHTPWQQPPGDLLSVHGGPTSDGWSCTAPEASRLIQDQMTEAMDAEFGRLLVEVGLATRDSDGRLMYDPKASNTIIAIIGDNGTLGTAVKRPFVGQQAKGTAYQTGVWDPLIVAGPQVQEPGREVNHMVNAVDLFQMFGEVAGLDVHQEVPRTLDSVAILPYLTNPEQTSLRSINFTIGGSNLQAHGARNGPCVISTSCTQSAPSESVCKDNHGTWWGEGAAGYTSCAEVNRARHIAGDDPLHILPDPTMAIRDERFKLVRNVTLDFDPALNDYRTEVVDELYEVDQSAPEPLLDTPDRNLLALPTPEVLAVYQNLHDKLESMLAAQPYCPGDGNKDGMVDAKDLEHWRKIAGEWGYSSDYDFFVDGKLDGLTNHVDETVIQNALNTRCPRGYALY